MATKKSTKKKIAAQSTAGAKSGSGKKKKKYPLMDINSRRTRALRAANKARKKLNDRKALAKKRTPKKPIEETQVNNVSAEQTPPIRPPFDVAMESLLAKGLTESFARLLLLDHMTDEQLQQLSVHDWQDMLISAQTDAEHNTGRIQKLFGRFKDAAESFEQLSWLLQELRTNHKDCECDTEIYYYSLENQLCENTDTDERAFVAFSLLDHDPPRAQFLAQALRWAGNDIEKLLSILERMYPNERQNSVRLQHIAQQCTCVSHLLRVAALLEGEDRYKFYNYAMTRSFSSPHINVLLMLQKTDDLKFIEEVLEVLAKSPQHSRRIIEHLVKIEYSGNKALLIPHLSALLARTESQQDFGWIFKAAIDLKVTAELQALLPSLTLSFSQWAALYELGLCELNIHKILKAHEVAIGIIEPIANYWSDGPLRLTILSMMVQTARTYMGWSHIYALAMDHNLHTLAGEALVKFTELIMAEEDPKTLLAMITHSTDHPKIIVAALWDELERRTNELMPPKSTVEPEEQAGGESGK